MARVARALDLTAGEARTVGVAVSGGSDSTALLVAAAAWGRASGRRIIAATLDHGLRPEAAAEAAGVAKLCRRLRVAHTTLTWRRAHDGRRPSDSSLTQAHVSQAKARAARHALLAGWARSEAAGVVAFGHTLDDRIETVLIRLRAGSGLWGLAGPLPSAPSPVWPAGRGVRLVRPMLAIARANLREALREAGETWIEDPSNTDRRHERVRVRAFAQRLAPKTRSRVAAIANRLAMMRARAMAEAHEAMSRLCIVADRARLPRAVLETLSPEARLRLVEALVLAAGGAGRAPPAALQRLEPLLAGDSADRSAVTLAGAWIRSGRGGLEVRPAPPRRGTPSGSAPETRPNGAPVSPSDTPSTDCAPDWDRAAALLADPRIAALDV